MDGIALVEYAFELKKKGCTIDLEGAAGGRRQLQRSVSGGMLEQWLDSDDYVRLRVGRDRLWRKRGHQRAVYGCSWSL